MTSRDGERASMEEERMNETIRQTLAASRRPPEPPLDAMWIQIEERVFGDARPALVLHTRASRWLIPTLAAAAALVFGVGLGWYAAPRNVVTQLVASPAATTPATQRTASAEATPSNTESAKSVASTIPPRANAQIQNVRSVATADSRDLTAARTRISVRRCRQRVGDEPIPRADHGTARIATIRPRGDRVRHGSSDARRRIAYPDASASRFKGWQRPNTTQTSGRSRAGAGASRASTRPA